MAGLKTGQKKITWNILNNINFERFKRSLKTTVLPQEFRRWWNNNLQHWLDKLFSEFMGSFAHFRLIICQSNVYVQRDLKLNSLKLRVKIFLPTHCCTVYCPFFQKQQSCSPVEDCSLIFSVFPRCKECFKLPRWTNMSIRLPRFSRCNRAASGTAMLKTKRNKSRTFALASRRFFTIHSLEIKRNEMTLVSWHKSTKSQQIKTQIFTESKWPLYYEQIDRCCRVFVALRDFLSNAN